MNPRNKLIWELTKVFQAPMLPLLNAVIFYSDHRNEEGFFRLNIVVAAYGIAIYFVLLFPVIYWCFIR